MWRKLTPLGKLCVVYTMTILCVLAFISKANAGTINIHMEWTHNGVDVEGRTYTGFKLLRTNPESIDEDVEVIDGADLRVWDGDIEVDEGRSTYYLVATTEQGIDSPRSVGYVFEYMEPQTPGMPAPTVIIKFN